MRPGATTAAAGRRVGVGQENHGIFDSRYFEDLAREFLQRSALAGHFDHVGIATAKKEFRGAAQLEHILQRHGTFELRRKILGGAR